VRPEPSEVGAGGAANAPSHETSAPPAGEPETRIGDVDTLRALAMTSVIAQHCKILPFGWMGVWLFFVISGFVVTTSLLSRGAGDPPPVLLRSFYLRRAARIWPIYWAYVAVGFGLSVLAAGPANWPAFASLLFFYNNFQSAFGRGTFEGFPVGHLWTISVEFQFYIVFGLAFAFLSRRALVALLTAFLAAAPILRFVGGLWLSAADFSPLRAAFAIYSFSPMHFDAFAAGALLALGRRRWAEPARARLLLMLGAMALIAYVGVYLAVNRGHGAAGLAMFRNILSGVLFGDQREVWLYSAVDLMSVGVLATTLSPHAPWARLVRSPLLQAVGQASYGGYVYHVLCLQWTRGLLTLVVSPGATMARKLEFGALHFALALPLVVVVAILSYRYVERPIIRWAGRRLAARAAPPGPSLALP